MLVGVAMRAAERVLAAALETRQPHALVASETPVGVCLLGQLATIFLSIPRPS